jgi:hypothetical protein
VEGARHQIERLGGNVVVVVFNAFDARNAARRGYGYYGYYGDYGNDGRHGAHRVPWETPAGRATSGDADRRRAD